MGIYPETEEFSLVLNEESVIMAKNYQIDEENFDSKVVEKEMDSLVGTVMVVYQENSEPYWIKEIEVRTSYFLAVSDVVQKEIVENLVSVYTSVL